MTIDRILLSELLEPYLPRMHYDEEDIKGLAQSIVERGLEQNIGINNTPKGLKPIYGTRRLKALEYLGVETIPSEKHPKIVIKDVKFYEVPDDEALLMAMEENKQRKDLTPYEEAIGLGKLPIKAWLKQGFKRRWVGQRLMLIDKLKPKLVQCTKYGSKDSNKDKYLLTFAKARSIWNLSHKDQKAIYNIIQKKGLTSTELKNLVSDLRRKRSFLDHPQTHKNADYMRKELREKYYKSPMIFKVTLDKLKEEVDMCTPFSMGLREKIRKRFFKQEMKKLFKVIYPVEGGYLQVAIDIDNLLKGFREFKKHKCGVFVGILYILPYNVEHKIPNKEKLEKYGYTIIGDKIVKVEE